MDWYINNPNWWGDVTGALLPHPRMLMMPGGLESHFEGSEEEKPASFGSSNTRMVVPSSKNTSSQQKHPFMFLIYGRTGWIGGLLGKLCEKQGIPYEYGKGRLEDRSSLLANLQNVKPTHVINAAGVTGRPNVDWCESHKTETIRTNVAGTLTMADVCREHGILMINYATGCIFEYNATHPEGSGIGFKEEASPISLALSIPKLKLWVCMPISSDLSNPRNFITKISRYNKVVNIPNSMTILDELLPISIEMAKRNLKGIWNFTNPGVVSHNEILEMYRDYIDPNFNNNEIDASKLKTEFPELLSIKESLMKYVFEPNKKT
ncbi:Trifunctional UDP-glucose 4,6-dehydratase/UDP-4-keto-6-deoxy-D-glucose 3,5-epimerase/UDP-4-keto-L-rhamnose-reductase RHM1 [Glycine max]|nr:Trifunctional UDP-glucose 4,6-dehydratase/UDP-4-keto-6-deoxy-D-glucose 3,5-epimerase/UDP-4-keto-L-rhamnose-reductase RHM1 [Glycine max]